VSLLFSACAKTGVPKKEVGPLPLPPPKLEKTFGSVHYLKDAALHIQYKTINLLIDPGEASLAAQNLKIMDYLLLTDAGPSHWGSGNEKRMRKNLKIMVPEDAASSLTQKGFQRVKGMEGGKRVLLKKDGGFLFVSSWRIQGSRGGPSVNGYLLEFDNGRNVFIGGETSNPDTLREFVYGIRDDGKELSLAFIYGSGNGGGRGCDEESCAEIMALLQPKIGVLVQADFFKEGSRIKTFESKLEENIFEGRYLIPKPGERIPF